jgi:hypothetical protein
VTLIDENIEAIDYTRVARADVVGLTGMVVQRARMREILTELKARDVFAAVGGPWVSVRADYDIWLVDSSSDKVYRYAGAASRLSGSQTAASSFTLSVHSRSSNVNPQDIVTDGTSFWLVDGTALKVFKYTLSGSLLGSWAIDPADAHPTGITINPANVSDIWIVDNGPTRSTSTSARPAAHPAARPPARRSPWPPGTPTRRASPTRPRSASPTLRQLRVAPRTALPMNS